MKVLGIRAVMCMLDVKCRMYNDLIYISISISISIEMCRESTHNTLSLSHDL